MTSIPALSVVLPTFNRRDSLPRALASVLGQSFTDLEVWVVDDGSTDDTLAWLSAQPDPRVKVLRLDRNGGQAAARNLGVRQVRSPYLAFQDSDDEWLPDRLAHQMKLLQDHPGVDMVYGDLLRIPQTGPSFVIQAPALVKGRMVDGRPSGYASYGLGIQTCLFRTAAFLRLRGFEERLHCFEDLELLLRFNRRFAARRLAQPLVRYHETQGVSKVSAHEYAARAFLLRRYWFDVLRQRPSWLPLELRRLRHRRRMDS